MRESIKGPRGVRDLDTLCCFISSKTYRDKECIVINVLKYTKSMGERDIMCNVSVDGESERFAGCYESKKDNKDIARMLFAST